MNSDFPHACDRACTPSISIYSIFLHTGDDAYPEDLDVTAAKEALPTIDSTLEELDALPAKFRCCWHSDPKDLLKSIRGTAKLRFGQVSPASPDVLLNQSAKL